MLDTELTEYVTQECCTSCKALNCKEKCECWHFAKKCARLGYNLGKKGNKPAYIKGMRTLANALKEYDRTFGACTDYFEHAVDKILKQELEKV